MGTDEGLKVESVANLDHMQPVLQQDLRRYSGAQSS